jgi:uncharacterized protein YjiK
MTRQRTWIGSALISVTLLGGCLAQSPQGDDLEIDTALSCYAWDQPAERWLLPDTLREISGLVHLDGDRWLGVHDNDATLWLLDLTAAPSFAPMDGPAASMDDAPSIEGDFEGLTRAANTVYLLASPGRIYRAELDDDGRLTQRPAIMPIGIEDTCNFEGLASNRDASNLWLACKYPRQPEAGRVHLYRLDPVTGDAARVSVDVSAVLDAVGLTRIRPSGLVWLPTQARLLVLAGKERLILEVDASGALLAWRSLSRRHHRQAEGLALAPDGRLLIGDEADGRTATLSLYPPRRVQGYCERL